MSSFSIGNQSGGVINNVAGDQVVHNQSGTLVVTAEDALAAVAALHTAAPRAVPDAAVRTAVDAALADVEEQVRAPEPDRPRAAGALERLTRLLASTGALVSAGAALAGPLQTLAVWLGMLGEPVLRLLAGA